MKTIKKEWQAIYNNKILLISFIVISCIPILYASFFLKSIWDPYGKTEDLPVAVVNKDKEVTYSGKTLNVGQELVDQLEEDHNLNWQFVSAEEAEKGLRNNEYYMIVTLPEDFSSNAATVMDDNPQKMNIEYKTNGGLNYLGEVVGETAMKQLKSEVSQKVTEVYAKAIFDQLSEVRSGFSDAAEGAGKLESGTVKLADGSKTLAENLNVLAKSTITFSDGEESFTAALGQYLEGTAKIDDGLTTLNTGVTALGEKVPALADGVGQLEEGSQKLSSGIQSYTGGVSKLADGAEMLAENGNTIISGVNTLAGSLSEGTTQLQNGASQITAGLTQMSEQLGAQIHGSKEQLEQLDTGLTQINDGLQQLNGALNGGTGNSFDAQTLERQLTEIGGATAAIGADTQEISNNLSNLPGNLVETVSSNLTNSSLDENQKNEVLAILQSALGDSVNLNSVSGSVADIANQVNTIANDTQALGSALTTLSATLDSAEKLSATVEQLSAGSAQAIPGAQQAIDSLSNGLVTVKMALDGKLVPGMQQLENGLESLKNGGNTGFTKLSNGVNSYITGVSQMNEGARTLTRNSDTLNTGAATLHQGLGELNMNVPVLQEGAQKLVNGTAAIKAGSTELINNNGKIMNGQKKLLEASEQLKTGSEKLADGGNTLSDGINTLKDGSGTLASALTEGSEKVNAVHTTDKTAKMIAEPNEVTQQKYSEVPNYGHALAPYVLSLALYVGCLVFNFIYPIRKISIKKGSALQWWLSKVSVGFVAATAMALIEESIMLALGLEPQNIPQYFVVGLASAYAYMFIIMFLAMAFDNPGRFVAMVLLILQLAGSGGTFPMPLTGKFFRAIHQYLPMTHSIYGFREAISSGLKGGTFVNNTVLLFCIAIVAILLLLAAMNILKKHHKEGVSQLDDNQKLLDDHYDYYNRQEA